MHAPTNLKEWKDVLPSKRATSILGVLVGDEHYHWSLMDGHDNKFTPKLVWRTPCVTSEDLDNYDDPTSLLARHILPVEAATILFGQDGARRPSREAAISASSARRIPILPVAIVCTGQASIKAIRWMLDDVPNRMFLIKNEDLPNHNDIPPKTDYAAALQVAAKNINGAYMIVDTGSELQFTMFGTNKDRIGSGSLLGCLTDGQHESPWPSHQEYARYLAGWGEHGHEAVASTDNGARAMVESCLVAFEHSLQSVIGKFVEASRSTSMTTASASTTATPPPPLPYIILTGDAIQTARELLNNPEIIGATSVLKPVEDYHLAEYDGTAAVFYDVASVLHSKSQQCDAEYPIGSSALEQFRDEIVGQRVAARFKLGDVRGDGIFRGTIQRVLFADEGNDWKEDLFQVRCDNGDEEQLDVAQLFDALDLYLKVGEESGLERPEHKHKRSGSEQCRDMLHELMQNNVPPTSTGFRSFLKLIYQAFAAFCTDSIAVLWNFFSQMPSPTGAKEVAALALPEVAVDATAVDLDGQAGHKIIISHPNDDDDDEDDDEQGEDAVEGAVEIIEISDDDEQDEGSVADGDDNADKQDEGSVADGDNSDDDHDHDSSIELIENPHQNDVLGGRGIKHPGNEEYNRLVKQHYVEYKNCKTNRKKEVAFRIIASIHRQRPKGRFLQRDGKTQPWYEMGPEQVYTKTMAALRDADPDRKKRKRNAMKKQFTPSNAAIATVPVPANNKKPTLTSGASSAPAPLPAAAAPAPHRTSVGGPPSDYYGIRGSTQAQQAPPPRNTTHGLFAGERMPLSPIATNAGPPGGPGGSPTTPQRGAYPPPCDGCDDEDDNERCIFRSY
eukprot:CAMPEP_0119553420 /NCGR_PEP_ID=MMETSP1352-20130426/6178_1 /TAXON_ID=265584 /ORGANISM="Stauroneis constricta, Strain CCMP1120" /LENGTH=843 /DNA_ID=CAMNT_0007599831 /DNA_START=103 /DNA_END=2634 /DNA_ORIENTATION=+